MSRFKKHHSYFFEQTFPFISPLQNRAPEYLCVMGVFFLTAPKTWIRPLFLDFFENRRNYAILMVHNVFQGHLEVAEHVFDIIFMFHEVFDSV